MLLGGLLLGSALPGCDVEQGLHVVVTTSPDSFAGHPFDWIEVTARQGDKAGSSCLYPADRSPSAVTKSCNGPGCNDACADRVTAAFSSDVSWLDWNFEDAPGRTLNFVSRSDAPISLELVGGIGNAITVSNSTVGVPDSSFPSLEARLEPADPIFGTNSCELLPEVPFDGAVVRLPSCKAPCLRSGLASAETSLVSAAAMCLGDSYPNVGCTMAGGCDAVRILNTTEVTSDACPDDSIDTVLRTFIRPTFGGTITLVMSLRFARCMGGDAPDCQLTSACQPPETSAWLEVYDDASTLISTERLGSLSCLPATTNPLWVKLAVPSERLTRGARIAASLRQVPVEQDGVPDACSLYLDGIGLTGDI